MPHSKSSCQKTTYRRYRKGAFFFLFPTSLVDVRKGAWREEKTMSAKTADHRNVHGLSPADLTIQINKSRQL